jgi:preprotein translocase subunit YajC
MSFFIEEAFAEGAAQQPVAPSPWINLVLLGGMVIVFYFLLWRPQSKRQKEHQNLMNSLNKGDEIITSGGLLGKITKVSDDFITIEIANNVSVNIQKASVSAALPKGTIKAIV